jgi:hypothetical protein
VPKSRVRAKSVYTPPQRAVRSKVGARWVAPTFITCAVVGLAWIAVFYVTGGSNPVQSAIGNWNLLIGFVLIVTALLTATRWK